MKLLDLVMVFGFAPKFKQRTVMVGNMRHNVQRGGIGGWFRLSL